MDSARRRLVTALTVTAVGAALGFVALNPDDDVTRGAEMSPSEVLAALDAGDITLIDIRRPDEWTRTGLAPDALPIDMRRDDFIGAVSEVASGGPIALICARGVRSRRMAAELRAAGIGPIIDVPEGMLGSSAGPGWVRRGLPVVSWNGVRG